MRVHGGQDFLIGRFQTHGQAQFGHQFRDFGPDQMRAQQLAVGLSENQLDHAIQVPDGVGFPRGRIREAAHPEFQPLLLALLFGESDRRHLGLAIGAGGNLPVIHRPPWAARDHRHRRLGFRGSLVGQQLTAGHIPDGENMADIGAIFSVHRNKSLFGLHARFFQRQPLQRPFHADGDQSHIAFQRGGRLAFFQGGGHFSLLHLERFHRSASVTMDAFFAEGLVQYAGDFRILAGEQLGQHLHQMHFHFER